MPSRIYTSVVTIGDVDVYNGTTADASLLRSVTMDGTNNKHYTVDFEFIIPDAVPGDMVSLALTRDGVGDPYTGNIDILLIEAEAYFWA